MTNSIKAIASHIASHSALGLAEALASAGVSAERCGALHGDEACHVDGYGTVFFHDSTWQVRDMDGCEDRIDNDELAEELAEIITMTKQIL